MKSKKTPIVKEDINEEKVQKKTRSSNSVEVK